MKGGRAISAPPPMPPFRARFRVLSPPHAFMPMANPNRIITLCCWVLGMSRISFCIDIEDSRTVYDLMEAILDEKRALAGLDADELVLWKVCIPDEGLVDEKIRHSLPQDNLPSSSILSELFPHPGPALRSIHIVIQVQAADSLMHRNKRKREEDDLRPQKACGFPFMTSYEDDRWRVFTHRARLDDERLVFSASLDESALDECIIKFTGQYSEAAHRYLASCSLAPRLRRCIQLTLDWTAVIMDRSKYKVLNNLELSAANKERVLHKVRIAVETLHQGGFVHGDLRDTNILVDPESLTSGDVAIHIIDFDWAGRTGQARYPVLVNTSTVRRPFDVKGGELIAEKHDMEMLSYLF